MTFRLIKAGTTGATRATPLPPGLIVAIARLGEEAAKAGVVVEMDGLMPGGAGRPVRVSGGKHTPTDGPFAESKELIGGFSVMELSSIDEAVALCRPYAEILGGTLEIDVRVVDLEDESA